MQRNFAQIFAQMALKVFACFQIFSNTHLGFKQFPTGFAHFCNKYLDFCKFAVFWKIIEVEPKGFQKTYEF